MDKAPDAYRTISEAADELGLEQHVLRFWETRFSQIKPLKRGGGRRYYRPDDLDFLRGLQRLLHVERFTIKGVQKIIKDQGVRRVIALGRAAAAGAGMAPVVADVQQQVTLQAAPPAPVAADAPVPALTAAERQRLGAALEDLMSARRTIDAALGRA